jgi:hypothetical protein
MAGTHVAKRTNRFGSALVAVGLMALAATSVGAAERVVLGEYFTSLF